MSFSSITLPIFLGVCCTIFHHVGEKVTRPFIDEIFHLRQCQVYCKHDFSSWDDKITTPPGLYILGTAYSHVLHGLGVDNSCGQDALRSLNLVAGAVVLPLVLSMASTANFWRVNVMSLPLLFSYYFLFYTDVWSTVLVVACVLCVAKSRSMSGSVTANVVGFLSLWFRQTNIVWVAFAGLVLVDFRRRRTPTFWGNARAFVSQALHDWLLLVPFCINGALFAAFLKINGGITFGDKENHHVTVHLVQIFYCFTFMAVLTFPVWVSRSALAQYVRFAVTGNKWVNIAPTVASFVAINWVIENFTVVHPFLLADNRHYTFYIYRKILSRPLANLALVPVYHFCTWAVFHSLVRTSKKAFLSISPVLTLGFFAAIAATLIPSPLFEPRYYIVPLVLFRVFITPESSTTMTQNQRHLFEFLWYTSINVVFFIVFFGYEFTWVSEPGTQRIIW
ncbi:hypothetical protein JCM33374_g4328 [Metschnikowia sp. JCM 33374]|nr:hypothetical protein JCM33374_g4328 [Metschnikowia sp. JCM 33374]